MPIIKSAKKRVRVARKATVRNAKTKRNLKTALKAFATAVTGTKASDSHRKAQSAVDTAVKKGVMSKNKAARKKRQLNAKAKAAGTAKPAAKKKTVAKKAAPKKTAAKKAPAKKKK